MNDTFLLKVGCQNLIKIFSGIVRPKAFYFYSKLVLNHRVKVRNNTTYIRFLFNQKYSFNPSAITNQRNKASRPRTIWNCGWSPIVCDYGSIQKDENIFHG